MRSSRVIGAVGAILGSFFLSNVAAAQGQWQQPAADLAAQIAAILGHGAEKHETARLMIRNLSSMPVDEIPAIRKQLEQDLRAHGVTANSAPNETVIRLTLSESARGGTWVAEVIRGDETEIAVVDLPADQTAPKPTQTQFMLRREALVTAKEPVLAALEQSGSVVLLTPNRVVVETHSQAGWAESQSMPIQPHTQSARDPRAVVVPSLQGAGFEARLAEAHCTGTVAQSPATGFAIDCQASDDPWLITAAAKPSAQGSTDASPVQPSPQIRAIYNATRNYFTGVVSPGMGVDLPPFYSGAVFERTSGTTLLINAIDGRVLIASNGKLTAVNGTDDWGSDFALIQSGCGTGTQVIVSGADTSDGDTLRSYQVTGTEATPSSAPLQIEGTVTALQTEPDGKSVLAFIRNAQNQYEVDRVTALCD
jgi:hypothetical protein